MLVGKIGQRFVHVRHEQLLAQEFDLHLEFCFGDVELEAGLQQREQILDVVHPTGNRFEQEDIFWTHDLDYEIPRVEIAFAPEDALRSSSVLPLVSLAGTPLTDALGTEFFVRFVRLPNDIVSQLKKHRL